MGCQCVVARETAPVNFSARRVCVVHQVTRFSTIFHSVVVYTERVVNRKKTGQSEQGVEKA